MKQLLVVLLILYASCKDAKKSEMAPNNGASKNEISEVATTHPGKKILETECYICHNPKASMESMIAPPMIAVKQHYIDSNTTKEEFTEALIYWVNDPEQESKMPRAIKKFGSMPYIPYPDDAIAQIAEYLYDYDIEKPDWFDAHFKTEHGRGKGKRVDNNIKGTAEKDTRTDDTDRGLKYASAGKAVLGKNLIKAISEKGTVGAVEFCNSKASILTDSLSVMKNAIIERVSDKPRNTENAANQEELGYITYFKKLVAAGTQPKPIVKTEKNEVHFYYPITTNTMCLQCHGKPNEQILPETLTTLKNLYPEDKAIGYTINEVRGIWSINFESADIK